MSLFKRQGQGEETSAQTVDASAQSGQQLMPPFVAAGVVPPPAAPIYSMSPPDAPQAEAQPEMSVADKLRIALEAQQVAQDLVQKRVRVAVERAKSASSSSRGGHRRRARATLVPASRQSSFDPVRCAQAGLLNLAWNWQQAGAPIRAIHAYMQVLERYPDTAGADAAVADLVELSDRLAEQGQFHIALSIYEELEHRL